MQQYIYNDRDQIFSFQLHQFLRCSQFFLTKSLVSVVLIKLMFLANTLCAVFIRTLFFTAYLCLRKSTRIVSNSSISNL